MSSALRVGFLVSGLVHIAVVAAISLAPPEPLPASQRPGPLTMRLAVFEPVPAAVTAPASPPPAPEPVEQPPQPPAPERTAMRPAAEPPPRPPASAATPRPVRPPVQRRSTPPARKRSRPEPKVVQPPQPERRAPRAPDDTVAPESVAAAETEVPRPPARAIDPQARQHYLAELAARINRKKYYPRASRRRGEEGRVVVSFVIRRSGELTDLVVTESSGSRRLDEAALKTVRRVSPFRPIPDAIGREHWSISVPIAFSLRG